MGYVPFLCSFGGVSELVFNVRETGKLSEHLMFTFRPLSVCCDFEQVDTKFRWALALAIATEVFL